MADKKTAIHTDDMQDIGHPPGAFTAVYITAKLVHAQMLVDIKKNWPRLYFTARWPITTQHASEKDKLPKLWTKDNETDMLAAQVVVGFSALEESTPLRDPLWELGEAHMAGKPIYLAGPMDRFGKYAFCSSVVAHFETLDATLLRISHLTDYVSDANRIDAKLQNLDGRFANIEDMLRQNFKQQETGG